MRKSVVCKILAAVVCLCMVFALTACSKNPVSAYEIAVKNGFVGSEADWLASLKGESAEKLSMEDIYESAVENGYTGSYLEFLKEYLSYDASGNVVTGANKALRSAVSVVGRFTATNRNFFGTYQETYTSSGSGVIIGMDKDSGNAYIVTNYHVVYSSYCNTSDHIIDDISVYIYGKEYSDYAIGAEYVGGSLNYDIAVLKVTGSDILRTSDCVEAKVADSSELVVGQTVMAVGNAEGNGISVTKGIVSVASEYIEMTAADGVSTVSFRVVRVDAGINSGNSGGGLFDENGNLVGIVNAKMVDEEIEAMGYAIPSNNAYAVARQIIDNGKVTKCLLGVTLKVSGRTVDYDAATGVFNITEQVVVESIGTGAASNVLKKGDVMVSFTHNGTTTKITRDYILLDLMLRCRVGDEVTVRFIRDGAEREATITIGVLHVTTVG